MVDLAPHIAAFRNEVRARGFHERPLGRFLISWAVMAGLGLSGLSGMVLFPGLFLKAAALAVCTYGFVGLATLGHTASHNSACNSVGGNRFLYYLTYPFMLQMSATYWTWSHVQLHHPAPNLVGVDLDCDLGPVFALNDQQIARGGRGARWYRWQGLLLPLLLPLNGLNIIRQSWARLFRELRTPAGRTRASLIDLGCMLAHVAVWLVLPMFFLPVPIVLGLYLIRLACVGSVLFAVLAPAHYPAAAICLDQTQRDAGHFWLRQLACTVNFRTGFFGSAMCSGLDLQIEHHLFPTISHFQLRRLRPLVRAFCERHGLPYRELPWARAVWESYLSFWRPKRVVTDVASLLERTDRERRGVPG